MTKLEEDDVKIVAELPYKWDILNNKTIMISGGTGFIASFIISVLMYRNKKYKQNIKVISLSRHGGISDEYISNLKVDITLPIEYEGDADYILHMASNTHPKQYADDPVGTITTNVLGCNNLLVYAKNHNVKKFLLTSSVEIYGEGDIKPITEKYSGYIDCNNARSGYNEAKRICEALCQSYRKQYGLSVVICRLGRVFGADKKKDSKAMSQFMDNAIKDKDIVLKSNGNQRYSYCYVADAASAIIFTLISGIDGEAYNVSDDDENKTLGDYAEYIAQLANRKVIYCIENNESVSRATYALLDTSRIKQIGWMPQFSVSDGLRRTYEIKKNRE